PARAGKEPCRVVVVGDPWVSEQGMAATVGRDKRYQVCGGARDFFDAGKLIRKHKPDVLLIEPLLEDRDGIRVQDLAADRGLAKSKNQCLSPIGSVSANFLFFPVLMPDHTQGFSNGVGRFRNPEPANLG